MHASAFGPEQQPVMTGGSGPSIDRRQIEAFQEIVIRAHYLSLELRDLCAPSGLAPAQMSLGVAQMLRNWAIAFSRAIEAAEARGDDGAGARPR